jgi:hypothetical protein
MRARLLVPLAVLLVLATIGVLHAQSSARVRVAVGDHPSDESGAGDFDASQAIRMFRARTAAIRSCAERVARDGTGNAIGVIPVTFTIGEDGQVRNVIAGSSAVSVEVSACIVRVANGMRFDPPPAGGSVTYTVSITLSAEPPSPPAGPGAGS